ncbi:MAG: bifunctional riboflavin kinase/FAD synthetase [Pseudomonadota bacterium]|nr:bifunctional riboflavin kinase/FAD synthetase [Pseudomonadota bacterium]
MITIRRLEDIPEEFKGSFVTIGNFDGVHRGHQFLFDNLVRQAHDAGAAAVAITFEPHPKMVLHPERRPFYLIATLEEKIELIAAQGVDGLLIIPFSLEYSRITAQEFVRDLLWERLRIRKIFIGHDYTFGRGKEGNEAFLVAWGERLGFAVEVMNAFTGNGDIISSTLVRNAILAGDVKKAAACLGRPYNLAGRVVVGHRRGASLGFPTANIQPEKALLPARGVYAALAKLAGRTYRGVLNIGMNPTFADECLSVEVHLLDFNEDIYGQTLEALFWEKLREEIKFSGPAPLIAQIERDIARARELLP